MSRNKFNPTLHNFVLDNGTPISYSGYDLGSVVCALRNSPNVRIRLDKTGIHTKIRLYSDSERAYTERGTYERLVGQYFDQTFVYVVRDYIRKITNIIERKTMERQKIEERSFTVFSGVREPSLLSFLLDFGIGCYSPSSNGLRTDKHVPPYIKGTRLVVESGPLFGLNYDGLRKRLSIFLGEDTHHLDQDAIQRVVGEDGDISRLVARIGKSLNPRVVELLDHGISLLER